MALGTPTPLFSFVFEFVITDPPLLSLPVAAKVTNEKIGIESF
jgi:hypothetical protein